MDFVLKFMCQKNLVAARRAAVAWRKINVFRKILTTDIVDCGRK
jgi:hypothetical protein